MDAVKLLAFSGPLFSGMFMFTRCCANHTLFFFSNLVSVVKDTYKYEKGAERSQVFQAIDGKHLPSCDGYPDTFTSARLSAMAYVHAV